MNLRIEGFCDQAVHDATQIVSYFNYINRVADSLAVELEEDVHAWELSAPSSS
jgi:alkylhydroperoxidase family enzyme